MNFVQVYNEATGGLPIVLSAQGTLTCVGSGVVDEIHVGFTVNENGEFSMHNIF